MTVCVPPVQTNGRFTCPWANSKPSVWSPLMHSSVISFIACASFAPWIRCLTTDSSWRGQGREYLSSHCSATTCIWSVTLSACPPTSSPTSCAIPTVLKCFVPAWALLRVMKLLGHSSPKMTMHYVDVTLTDLQREFQLARSKPRHLAPQPKTSPAPVRAGLHGLIDSLLATQHVMEMVRRSLINSEQRARLNRLVNRLTKSLSETRKLRTI